MHRQYIAYMYIYNFISSIFDILNSRSPLGKYFKSAINSNNSLWLPTFEKAYEYISNLKDASGNLLCDSNCKTGFVGFIISMKSVEMLSQELVFSENPPLRLIFYSKD